MLYDYFWKQIDDYYLKNMLFQLARQMLRLNSFGVEFKQTILKIWKEIDDYNLKNIWSN